jgi:hypothetical protein
MGRRISLEPHVTVDELGRRNRAAQSGGAIGRRNRAAQDPHERSWWQILWLLGTGQTAAESAESTGYTR